MALEEAAGGAEHINITTNIPIISTPTTRTTERELLCKYYYYMRGKGEKVIMLK